MPVLGSPLRQQVLGLSGDDLAANAQASVADDNAQRSAFGAGFAGAAADAEAGSLASRALAAERNGDQGNASSLRALALSQAQDASAMTAGHTNSFHDIHGLGDAADYLGTQLGTGTETLLPLVAAGLLTRGRSIGPVGEAATAQLGAGIPFYESTRSGNILRQYQDPTTANADPELRDQAASRSAMAQAALGSIVPGGLAARFGHAGSALGAIARGAGEMGAISPAMAAIGQVGQEAVRQGGLNQAALMAPLDPKNRDELEEATVSGLIQGGGIALPTAGSHVAANALLGARDAAMSAGKTGLDVGKKALAKTGDLAQDLGTKLKDYSDEQLAQHLAGDAGPTLVPHNPAEEALKTSTDPAEIMQAQEAYDAGIEPHINETAHNIVKDEDAPPELKQTAMQVLAGKTPLEIGKQMLESAKQVDYQRHATNIKDMAVKAIDRAKSAIDTFANTPLEGVPTMITKAMRTQLTDAGVTPEAISKLTPQAAWDKLNAGKKSSLEETDVAPLVDKLYQGLDPQYKTDKSVRDRLEPLARTLSAMEDRSSTLTRPDVALLQDMHNDGVFKLFTDPSKALGFGLQKALAAATRASADAAQDDSWMSVNLKPAFQDPRVRANIGQVIDRAAIGGKVPDSQKALLARAFGDAKTAKDVIAHYSALMPKLEGKVPEVKDDISPGPQKRDTKEIGDPVEDNKTVSYQFANPDGTVPFLAPRTVKTARNDFGVPGKRSELQNEIRARNATDRSQRSRLITVAEHAKETGANPADAVGAFIKAHTDQAKQDKQRTDKAAATLSRGEALDAAQVADAKAIAGRATHSQLADAHLEYSNYDASKPLSEQPEVVAHLASKLHVVRREKTSISGNTGHSAEHLYKEGRKAIRQADKIDTRPETVGEEQAAKNKKFQQAVKASRFQVIRKIGDTERPTSLSAASLLKAARDTTQSTGESHEAYTHRLFTEALGDLATSDRSITGFKIPHDLVLDLDSGQKLNRPVADMEKAPDRAEALVAAHEQIGQLREHLNSVESNVEDLHEELSDPQTTHKRLREVRDEIGDHIDELRTKQHVLRDALAMTAPTETGRALYERRMEAELRPEQMKQIRDMLKAVWKKPASERKAAWKAAFKARDKIVLEHATSTELRLAAQAKVDGAGGTEPLKTMRDMYKSSIDSMRDDLTNATADQRFGDTEGVDHAVDQDGPVGTSDLPRTSLNEALTKAELGQVREFDDFNKKLHPKTDDFGPATRDRQQLNDQAKRAYQSMAEKKTKLWKGVAKALLMYIHHGVLPSNEQPRVDQAAQMRTVMEWINAKGPARAAMEERFRRGNAMPEEQMTKGIYDQMVGDARERVRTAAETGRQEADARVRANQWLADNTDYVKRRAELQRQAIDEVTKTSKAKGKALRDQIERRVAQLVQDEQLAAPTRVPAAIVNPTGIKAIDDGGAALNEPGKAPSEPSPKPEKTASDKRYSAQETKGDPLKVDAPLKATIKAEMTRILGKDVKLAFSKDLGGASGEYNPATRMIRLALAATNPLATAYHEGLHDFFNSLSGSEEGRRVRQGLMEASSSMHVRAQLAEFFKRSPGALAQIEADAEERAAYAFQLWALGKHVGHDLITLSPQAHNIFTKVATFIRQLFGAVSSDERAEQVFQALYDGQFSKPSEISDILKEKGLLTLGDKMRAVAGPLANVSDKMMRVATDRLRDLGHARMDWLADQFMKEPGREGGTAAFLPRRAQVRGKFVNDLGQLFHGTTAAERRQAVTNLQGMKPPSTPLEKGMRDLLDKLHDYQAPVVKNLVDGKWEPMGKVADYFPRVWDGNKIMGNKAAFRELLTKHGVSLAQAIIITDAITHGDGHIPLDASQYQVGYTPFAASVENRALTFIDASNAHEFADFQSKDLAHIMGTYINQAVHRAEFARQFGNAGEKIDAAIDAASDKLDGHQLAEARTTVKALIGTLGADMNPRTKQLMSTALTAENIILLPLTMFSQVIDAVGVGLRANDVKEAWNAMGRGFGEITRQVLRKDSGDYDTWMSKTLGIIEDASVVDAMTESYGSAFLSDFARKANRQFFKWNGMEAWNRGMRIAATVAGERFVLRNADNDRYMREMGITKADIMPMANGRLAVTADQMKTVDPKLDDATAAERERRVQEGLFRFVDGAVLRPSAANRPVWGSDPHWMLMFHLKQFSFTFQKTILARVSNELEHGNIMPGVLLAAYVPVIMASTALKASLTGHPIGDGSMMSTLMNGINRSGILGARSFGSDALGDLGRGQLPGTSFLGPAVEHAWLAGRWAVGDPNATTTDLVQRTLPMGKYLIH